MSSNLTATVQVLSVAQERFSQNIELSNSLYDREMTEAHQG